MTRARQPEKHYSYTAYADPAMAQSFERKRFTPPTDSPAHSDIAPISPVHESSTAVAPKRWTGTRSLV